MDIRKFWTQCRLHDWFYTMSDDLQVYREGEESLRNLERIMQGRPDLYAVYDAWRAYSFEAGAPRPTEPKLED